MYSQVVIKDEIVLDDTGIYKGTESVSLVMPFYGKISGCVNWGAMWGGWLKRVIISAGGQTVNKGFDCGIAGYLTCGWSINDLPSGTGINITVYGSCINNQLVESETQIIQTGNNKYDIKYYSYLGNWQLATTLEFIPTQPTGNCPNAGGNYCDSSSWVEIPDVELVPYPGNATNFINVKCEESEDRYAFFSTWTSGPTNIYSLTPSNVTACYNQINQTW